MKKSELTGGQRNIVFRYAAKAGKPGYLQRAQYRTLWSLEKLGMIEHVSFDINRPLAPSGYRLTEKGKLYAQTFCKHPEYYDY